MSSKNLDECMGPFFKSGHKYDNALHYKVYSQKPLEPFSLLQCFLLCISQVILRVFKCLFQARVCLGGSF